MTVDIGYAYGLQTAVLAAQSPDVPTCEDCGDDLDGWDGTTPAPSICESCFDKQAPAVAA